MKANKILAICVGALLFSNADAASLDSAHYKNLKVDARQKVEKAHINLEALLSNTSNDLIVELKDPAINVTFGQQKRNQIADDKTRFKNAYKQLPGLTVLRDYNSLPITTYRISNQDTLVKLLNDPEVKAVYPNLINKASGDLESLALIGQPQAAIKGFDGAGTSVVIADSGLDYRHADFGNCTAVATPSTCRVIQNFDTALADNQLDDSVKHGTNVAGIVANVAPKAKLIGIDVFRANGAYDSDVIAAVNWAINNAQTYNIKAINLSLGAPGRQFTNECSSSYTTAFANARNSGVVPVVAAGNDGFTNGVSTPACTPGAVRVGAVYDSNLGGVSWPNCTDYATAADKVTCFSNSGKLLTLLAPGSSIVAAGVTQSGTSQASPHVAGVIAVLRSNKVSPQESVDQTIKRLQTTGKPITDHRNGVLTSRINLLAATAALSVVN